MKGQPLTPGCVKKGEGTSFCFIVALLIHWGNEQLGVWGEVPPPPREATCEFCREGVIKVSRASAGGRRDRQTCGPAAAVEGGLPQARRSQLCWAPCQKLCRDPAFSWQALIDLKRGLVDQGQLHTHTDTHTHANMHARPLPFGNSVRVYWTYYKSQLLNMGLKGILINQFFLTFPLAHLLSSVAHPKWEEKTFLTHEYKI